MKSIAIWYTPATNNAITLNDVELHFNFWKIPNGTKKHQKFLDIGVKLDDTSNVESLNLYFPKPVTQFDFEDIVSKFIDKADLVSAIFNENYKVTSDGTKKSYEITDSKNNFVFTVYKTSSNSDIVFQPNICNGTIVKIRVLKQNRKLYYRFRLKGEFIDSLSIISKPTNAILESAFSEIEMIDFRVNEIRDLNQDLLEIIGKEVLLKIRKQHFFFICSNEEEVIGNHQPFISCRNLENYRWNKYVDLPNSKNNVFLAYHWTENNKESVSTLIKTKYEKNNWKTIGKYFLIAFIIAILIGLFTNWLYDLLMGVLNFKCN